MHPDAVVVWSKPINNRYAKSLWSSFGGMLVFYKDFPNPQDPNIPGET